MGFAARSLPPRPLSRVVLVAAVAVVVAIVVAGCATAPFASASAPGSEREEQRGTRRLRSLEPSFHAFTAQRLRDLDDVEAATAQLEQLRMEYLDALSATTTAPAAPGARSASAEGGSQRDPLLALVRLAELHLDLGARVRRVPYPPHLDERQQRQFDVRLSALALPFEATGQGILEQLVQRADRDGKDGRFVRRARLYLRLHAHRGDVLLDDEDVAVLRTEMVAQTFRAPRSLLEVGRVGQRAARR